MKWRKAFLGFLIILNLVLFGRLVWSDQGFFAYLDMKARADNLQNQLDNLNNKLEDLSGEIRRLQKDQAYQEKAVRDKMNYVKDSEILYIFPETVQPTDGAQSYAE
ncbi:MAG: FtsB family cell division protein [Desulfovibrio sp.]